MTFQLLFYFHKLSPWRLVGIDISIIFALRMNNTNIKDLYIMKRVNNDERNSIVTEVMGEEYRHTMMMITDVFTDLVRRPDDGSGFPLWGESKAKLMELAYVLAKSHVFVHRSTGTPASMAEIAARLCKALHCRVPSNIYQPVLRLKKRGRGIVDYYAKLWRENRTSPKSSLLWSVPYQFPMIEDYTFVFDSPAYRLLQRNKKKRRRKKQSSDVLTTTQA